MNYVYRFVLVVLLLSPAAELCAAEPAYIDEHRRQPRFQNPKDHEFYNMGHLFTAPARTFSSLPIRTSRCIWCKFDGKQRQSCILTINFTKTT
jgi:hypothetical protein